MKGISSRPYVNPNFFDTEMRGNSCNSSQKTARIREIEAKEKLQYLYSLLSAVLPIVKQIHTEQCIEVELEKRLRGNEIDLPRTKLNADEQMCCDFCRIPIIDYHRHCTSCSYERGFVDAKFHTEFHKQLIFDPWAPRSLPSTDVVVDNELDDEISVSNVNDILSIIISDYENAYFVTDVFTSAIYAEDCIFEDPTIKFQGNEVE